MSSTLSSGSDSNVPLTATTGQGGGGLSNGVIAGLAILGAAVLALFAILSYGYYLRRQAKLRPRIEDTRAVGLEWTGISYTVILGRSTKAPLPRLRDATGSLTGRRPRPLAPLRVENSDAEVQDIEHQSEGKPSSTESDVHLNQEGGTSQHRILSNVSSKALPGTLNYILGPSGAGKSSLVDVLAGRAKRGQVSGTLATLQLGAGQAQTEGRDRSCGHQIALVDQEDSVCLPGYMTVHEMLSFSAELSLPENVPKEQRLHIVDQTIQTLGLESVAHSRIGDARSRGISGGERRRVSLGVALVGRPKILIADECTSGLDAFSAFRVMKALRQLASGEEGGITIIATLHQPSSQIFALADSVTLLSHGTILYAGEPNHALDFCRVNGIPVPPGHNVADHLLTYAFEHQRSGEGEREKPQPLVSSTSSVPHAAETAVSSYSASAMGSRQAMTQSEGAADHQDSALRREPLVLEHGGAHTTTTFITQLHALINRALIMTKRDLLGATAHVGGAAVVSVFVGACFFQVKLNLGGFQNRVGSMFFIFIMILFMDLTAIIGLANVRLLMMRERANGLYSPWSWVTAHLAFDLILLRAIPVIIMVSIIYWMVGLNHHASNFFLFMLIAVIFSWTIAIYNMAVAAMVEEQGTTILLTSLYVLFNIFMAGFLMSLDSMPAAVRWLRWIAPAKYALEAVASNELRNLVFEDTFAGVPIKTSVSLFANKLFGFQDGSYYRDLIVLACGFLVGFGLLLFTSVWWRMRELR